MTVIQTSTPPQMPTPGRSRGLLLLAALLGAGALGCEPGGVGDPCIPEDEYTSGFSGFNVAEVNVESRSFQCETRVCLVNHFQGRVSCPYGQDVAGGSSATPCHIPGSRDAIEPQLVVDPWLKERGAEDAVYCSCRCDGDNKAARYCECPSGFKCEKLIDDLKLGAGELAGSYCVRDRTSVEDVNGIVKVQCELGVAGELADPARCGGVKSNP